jgi:microcystin-dependent protein
MAELFRTGDGSVEDKIIVALELVNNDWFRRNFIHALELMCEQFNWEQVGNAGTDFARDKSNEMLESVVFDVIISTLPIGAILMHGSETAPTGWLLCDGSTVSRETYAALFAAISTVWGNGDGSTTFNLPDFRYRSPMGVSVNPNLNIAEAAGEAAHALTAIENAQHSHAITDPGHFHTTVTTLTGADGTRALVSSGGAQAVKASGNTASATTGIISTDSAGSSVPHNTVHPVRGVPFMIYTGV